MVLESQFTYLREYLPTLSIDERIAYCESLGNIFEEIVSDPNVLFDERDCSLYRTVTIGNQTWMAENLRYDIEGSYLNPKNPSLEYGRLYNWDAAMKAVPKGWHLPSDKEWTILQDSISGSEIEPAMKSITDWNNNGNGTNTSGFNAFPAGNYYNSGSFYYLGADANFWSSTEYSGAVAWIRYLDYGNTGVYRFNFNKSNGYSCRCVKNI
tara:strand:+ start:264 stop:893 length:630 start_codon:yes stop_codon:yes gene_type:complete